MTNRRNTIQKDLVKNAVYEMKRHVTANEVYEFLKKEYPSSEEFPALIIFSRSMSGYIPMVMADSTDTYFPKEPAT